ncbi:MAG: hypothetical protein ACLGXA_04055 [Acidobacteriota bacterium]
MRRALAVLLVTVFSLPLIAPAFASPPGDAQLPACCRRGGKHHCAMSMELQNIPSRFHVVSERCPYAPFGHAPFLVAHALATKTAAAASNAPGPAAVVRAAEAGYRISADRARHKRGPPAVLPL